jgi:hypothetical protein
MRLTENRKTMERETVSLDMSDVIVSKEPLDDAKPNAKPARKSAAKRKGGPDPVKQLAKAMEMVEKLERQNLDAAEAIQLLSELWLSADAGKKRVEAGIALQHFDAALSALRKSLAAM